MLLVLIEDSPRVVFRFDDPCLCHIQAHIVRQVEQEGAIRPLYLLMFLTPLAILILVVVFEAGDPAMRGETADDNSPVPNLDLEEKHIRHVLSLLHVLVEAVVVLLILRFVLCLEILDHLLD